MKRYFIKKINHIVFLFSLFVPCLSHAMWTPLHQAASAGKLEDVQELLKRGEGISAADKDGKTPLHWPRNRAVVTRLLDRGANLEATDMFGETPLHRAACFGRKAIVILFLEKGANIYAANKYHQTPLNLAELFNHTEVATLLRRWPKYQNLIKERKKQMYAFLMATHPRIGVNSPANVLPRELFQHIWEFVKPTIEEADNFEEAGPINRSWLSRFNTIWFKKKRSIIAGLRVLGWYLFKRR